MRCVFEDSLYVEISKLISDLYSESSIELIFVGGNCNLKDLLSDNCLIFVDVVPDNNSTISAYNKVASEIIRKGFKRCFLIPIPCIEYICINAFNLDRSESAIQSVLEHDDYRSVTKYRGRLLSVESFEKYCKSVLYNYTKCTNANGLFWKVDCLCNSRRNDVLCTNIDKLSKASRIILQFPISCSIYNHRQFKNILSLIDIQNIYSDCIELERIMKSCFINNSYISDCEDLIYIDYIELNR